MLRHEDCRDVKNSSITRRAVPDAVGWALFGDNAVCQPVRRCRAAASLLHMAAEVAPDWAGKHDFLRTFSAGKYHVSRWNLWTLQLVAMHVTAMLQLRLEPAEQ